MAAEVATGADRRKFIPLLRSDTWNSAAPSWLRGSYYVDIRGEPYSEENYSELVNTLHNLRDKAPPIGSSTRTANAAVASDEDEDEDAF